MKTDPKKTKKPTGSDEDKGRSELGLTGFIGLVLLAGALFNVPAILKVPRTKEDIIMLSVVLTMALGGGILLFFSTKNKKDS